MKIWGNPFLALRWKKSVDGTPAKILHPSKEDDHTIPASVAKADGSPPPPPPGVPAALTAEEEAAQMHITGTPDNAALLNSIKDKHDKAAEHPVEEEKIIPVKKK